MTHWLNNEELKVFVADRCQYRDCCPKCVFYQIIEGPHVVVDDDRCYITAQCCRFPPVLWVEDNIWMQPEVRTWDWCGEYTHNPDWKRKFFEGVES